MNRIIVFFVSFLISVLFIPIFGYLGLGAGFSLKVELIGRFITSLLLAIFLEPLTKFVYNKK